jgi:hypothetical protein
MTTATPAEKARTERVKCENQIKTLRALRLASATVRAREASEQGAIHLKQAAIERVREKITAAELDEAEAVAADLEATWKAAKEREVVTQAAIAAEELALKECLRANWDVFVADALVVSAACEKRMREANRAIELIQKNVNKAQAFWEPLVRAANLNTSIPKLDVSPVPLVPMRPPGVAADGTIISGEDEYGRQIGDVRRGEAVYTAEQYAEMKREEQARLAEARAQAIAPIGSYDDEEARDAARAMSQSDLVRVKQESEAQRLANIQATNREKERVTR